MANKSDFIAAEEIKAILGGRDINEQSRIIRWVSESLGLAAPNSTPAAPIHPASPASIVQMGAQHLNVGGGRQKDIKTFVNEKSPKSDVQFAAVAAYFYRFECAEAARKNIIVPKDLDDAGRQARGYSFKNALTTLNNAVALGYFDRGGKGEFKLNAVGENLVAMTLPNAGSTQNGGAKSRRTKKQARVKKATGK
jgi:hypothetical protein